MNILGQSITKNGLLLGLFAIVTTGVIAGTYLSTRGLIQDNIRHAEERALLEIFPKSEHDNAMLDDAITVDDHDLLGLRETKKLYRATMEGEFVGAILPATARDGYTGDIDMIVGIRQNGTISGVRVLSHRETPGLGDQVDYKKSQWVDGFVGKSLNNPSDPKWTVKKDRGIFDQFTGATITPRAVTQAVHKALQYYDANYLVISAKSKTTAARSQQ
ncbi:Electron transport complex subunit RnfG [Zhongshania aliphaticivorans]|uniref:Ion-translocating oxidoreductase complex subunit G n=1 Tax=Zhongshania aliphaticivorans TaxID=1470434 RepID=A0A5S9N4L7_9GAMM|nr:electron transport complex subunit RsxG [Zhongshania aliphaticivorans]CAA0082930.1 Electron transport complex subunit RnfG [Zhongshania aliphaticivorans]CAA0083810.1 Electron transport complex subunit RnfG [Zhongshania aliphaticivorans]